MCLFAFKVSNKKAYGKNISVEICARMESFLILYLNYTALWQNFKFRTNGGPLPPRQKMATHFFSFKFNKLNKSKAALFFTGILFLCLQTVRAEYYSFKELNFTMDIPEGFELKETGRNYDSFFFETTAFCTLSESLLLS